MHRILNIISAEGAQFSPLTFSFVFTSSFLTSQSIEQLQSLNHGLSRRWLQNHLKKISDTKNNLHLWDRFKRDSFVLCTCLLYLYYLDIKSLKALRQSQCVNFMVSVCFSSEAILGNENVKRCSFYLSRWEHHRHPVEAKWATHRKEAEPQHVVDAQCFELQDDGSQIGSLHLWHSRDRQFLKVLLWWTEQRW